MSPATSSTVLNVIYVDPDDDTDAETFLGHVSVDQQGLLTILDAVPDYESDLRESVADLNAKASLRVKTAPPPGSPMLQLHGEIYERGAANFLEGLTAYALAYFNYRLVSDEELERENADNERYAL